MNRLERRPGARSPSWRRPAAGTTSCATLDDPVTAAGAPRKRMVTAMFESGARSKSNASERIAAPAGMTTDGAPRKVRGLSVALSMAAAASGSRDVDGDERQRRFAELVRKPCAYLLAANRHAHDLTKRRVAETRCGRQVGVFDELGCGGPSRHPLVRGGLRGHARRGANRHPDGDTQRTDDDCGPVRRRTARPCEPRVPSPDAPITQVKTCCSGSIKRRLRRERGSFR